MNRILDTNSSNDSSSQNSSQQQQQQQQANKPKRNPYCSRCRNHGKIAQVKGHKRHCEYRDCQCEGCKLVECRQIVSAAQIKRRRYQKQDEECGRRIEVSPPVLTRRSGDDPMSLIVKTVGIHRHMSSAAANQLNSPPHQHQHQHQQQHQQQQNHHNHHHHHNQHNQQQQQTSKQVFAAAAAAAAASYPLFSAAAVAQAAQAAAFRLPVVGGVPHQPSSASYLPTLSMSAAAAATTTAAAAAAISTHHQQQQHLLTSMPSPQDQLNLVEELDRAFGPLIPYAWLKAEGFNLQKIRNLIEMSKIPFEELLQTTAPMDLTSPTVD